MDYVKLRLFHLNLIFHVSFRKGQSKVEKYIILMYNTYMRIRFSLRKINIISELFTSLSSKVNECS